MTDWNESQRKQWIQAGAPAPAAIPLCYRRAPDGSPAWRYVPASEQGPDYLRQRFAAMQGRRD